MAFTTTDAGEVLLLRYMLNNTPATDVRLHLYVNDVSVGESGTTGTVTESTAPGYSVKELVGSQWTVATAGGTSSATYARQTFTYTTSESVYGWYITNQASSTLIWAERFAGAPFQVPPSGGTIDIDTVLKLD